MRVCECVCVGVCVCVCVCVYTCITIDREIFAGKIFRRSPSTMKIKQAKYFLRRIIGIGLVPRVVISTKIKQRKNLTGENFTSKNFPIYALKLYGHVHLY